MTEPQEVVKAPDEKPPVTGGFFDKVQLVVKLVQEGAKLVGEARDLVNDLKEVYQLRRLERAQTKSEATGDTSGVEQMFKDSRPGAVT